MPRGPSDPLGSAKARTTSPTDSRCRVRAVVAGHEAAILRGLLQRVLVSPLPMDIVPDLVPILEAQKDGNKSPAWLRGIHLGHALLRTSSRQRIFRTQCAASGIGLGVSRAFP